MTFALFDRVRETAITTGTGDISLAGAVSADFHTFAAKYADGQTFWYGIINTGNGEWETGLGTYHSSGNTFSRTTIFESTNSGSPVSFSSGTKDVFVDMPASRMAQLFDSTGAISGIGTGDLKWTWKTAADPGFIMVNDGTIGNGASGATTRANADTAALFTLIWTNFANAQAAVSGGRGASAAADYAANKTIALPLALGRAIGISGSGSGLTARVLGATAGGETTTPTLATMFAHAHTLTNYRGGCGGGVGPSGRIDGTSPASASTDNSGSSTPFSVMQPTSFWNVMVKL